jgi:hypothetical protein
MLTVARKKFTLLTEKIRVHVMTTKSKVIGVRVDPATDARLAKFETETGVERVTLARNAMLAALDYYEKRGRISFPLLLIEPTQHPTSSKTGEDKTN